MPDDTGAGERTEQATPKKRQEARDEGQVAFSSEVNTALLLLCGLGVLGAAGPGLWHAMAEGVRRACGAALTSELSSWNDVVRVFAQQGGMLLWTGIILGLLFVIGLAASLAQVGLHLSGKALVPKLSRISPLQGLKRLFGLRGLMRFAFSFVKLVLVAVVAWVVLSDALPAQIYHIDDVRPRIAESMDLLLWLGLKLAAVLALIAAADYLYQRFQHERDLMMTKQEIKEEMKQSDGDPLVKSRIRQIQRQLATQRMMQEVPKADVVITNPTHVAVALRYDQQKMHAPVVVAKGYDLVAQRIKKIAGEHNVPMVENIDLARALAKEVDLGRPIPVEFYQAVAEVLATVFKLKGLNRASA